MKHYRSILVALGLVLGATLTTAPAATIEVVFSTQEIATIHAYYRTQASGGKSRGRDRKGLPPGIAKNLAHGKALPPGIAKQGLPTELATRLPPPPVGHERIIIEGKILLVEIATRVIHDVLTDVLFD